MTAALQSAINTLAPADIAGLDGVVPALRGGDGDAALQVCAATAWAAFVQPAALTAVWDRVCLPWLGRPLRGDSAMPELTPVADAPPAGFWPAFEAVLDDAAAGQLDAAGITARVAALGGLLDDGFAARAEAAARAHPGSAGAADQPMPPQLTVEQLAALPDGSLGNALYRLVTDNAFDLEVLDREAIGLAGLSPALRWLNTRILQMHDIWHLVAGYRTTALHEIAISAFQLAQFGHNYSGHFLATVLAVAWRSNPAGLPVLLQAISEAWLHGRESPALMAIDWEAEWHEPAAAVRARHGIGTYDSVLPADLFEQMALSGSLANA